MAFHIEARARRVLALMFVACLAGCSGGGPPMPTLPPAPTTDPHVASGSLTAPRWDVALVSGDTVQHAHANAAEELEARFEALPTPLDRLHVLSADKADSRDSGEPARDGPNSGRQRPDGETPDLLDYTEHPRRNQLETEPARPANLLSTLLHLDGRGGGACFAYIGSNPDDDSLEMLDGSVAPEEIDRALAGGCGNAPTVLVVSGCGTGAFAAAPVARSNRLILTAAPPGGSGFGCGPNLGYTTFDECFLGSLPGAATWVEAFDRTRRCVVRRSTLVKQDQSEPQISIGSQVASLPAPWKDAVGAGGVTRTVKFLQGIGHFTADGVPYYSTLKARNASTVDAYLHAPLPRAMALTLAGTVSWAASRNGETSDDVARLALQRCEYASGGACVLFVRDSGITAANQAGQPPIHAPTLARSGSVEAATVPFIRDGQRGRITDYLAAPSPKALALGPDSEAIGIGTGATAEAARTAALAACRSGGATCVIFADNDKIVLGAP